MPLSSIFPRLSYELHGDHGPNILLVMGFGMGGRLWLPQIEELQRACRLLTFDHAGLGQSDAPDTLPTIATMARGALHLLDEVGWRNTHVVGVSMGGMIAQEIALAAPDRVQSLTLIATHAGGPTAVFPPPEGLALFLQANVGNPAHRITALKRLLYPPSFLATADQAALDLRMQGMVGKRAPQHILEGHLHAVLRHDTRSRLGKIQAPAMIIQPAQDKLVRPNNSEVLARHIPKSRLIRFEDAGHGITFQCANALNQEITRFIQQNG